MFTVDLYVNKNKIIIKLKSFIQTLGTLLFNLTNIFLKEGLVS
jgi:hypothetical protein